MSVAKLDKMKEKKAVSQMAFIIIAFVLALMFLVVMSFISGGVTKNFLQSIGKIQEQTDADAGCLVVTGGANDKDGDALHDTKKKPNGDKCDPT